ARLLRGARGGAEALVAGAVGRLLRLAVAGLLRRRGIRGSGGLGRGRPLPGLLGLRGWHLATLGRRRELGATGRVGRRAAGVLRVLRVVSHDAPVHGSWRSCAAHATDSTPSLAAATRVRGTHPGPD